ncbi:tRNA pseudouridine(55) synthase TruB [Thalassobacillus devorans]|uniref:tRNA pseudouridine(55) synthase TruB n=1 Tax=Thalassobacillus devorans TaxID=279813 RepID=UPI001594858B|nr:tRNA pseudouridine(55) synthase TruB [Thalassobacillus devorans]
MDGILPVWKPKGWTSHDCVMKVRKILHTKKVGHTGTLDPDVEGVLPLCIGRATKIVPFLTDTTKVYEAVVTLGVATDTEDSSGEAVETKEVAEVFDEEQVKGVLQTFQGEIKQIPPMYSAVKIKGKKLYEYAREGKIVERPAREVYIHNIEMLGTINYEDGKASFPFRVVCSKGTYIRTLCVDIGKAIGYPAHMSFLERTRTGDIRKEDCYQIEDIEKLAEQGAYDQLLLPLERGLNHLDSWQVDKETSERVQHGQVLPAPAQSFERDIFQVKYQGKVLAIYQFHPEKQGKVKPVRVF